MKPGHRVSSLLRPAAALYHRVSTLDQNVTLARDELRGFASRQGYRVLLDVEEKGSGARNDRPGLARVIDAARRGTVSAVIVWKLDRFGRSALDLLANIRELDSAGARFTSITQGIDIRPGGDPMGRLLLTMLAAVAEFERDLISERTRLALKRRRKRGLPLGRPRSMPYELPEQVWVMRRDGMSWRNISHVLGQAQTTVRRACAMASKGPKGPARRGKKCQA